MSGPTFVIPDYSVPETPWPHAMLLRIMQVNALVAGLCSGYLAWAGITHGSVPGCSDGGWDCASVLSSPYSTWFGIPVGIPAAALYFTIFLALWFCPQSRPAAVRKLAWRLVVTCSLVAAAAGLWFMGVQAFDLMKFCLWCTTVHFCGIILGATALTATGKLWRVELLSLLPAIAIVALLVMGQFLQPAQPTYTFEEQQPPDPDSVATTVEGPENQPAEPSVMGSLPGDIGADSNDLLGRLNNGTNQSDQTQGTAGNTQTDGNSENTPSTAGGVSLYVAGTRGHATIKTHQFPMLGKPTADHILVKLFDYTCPHCRHLHKHLHKVQQANPDKIAIVLMPVPMNTNCNRHIDSTHSKHAEACDLAKLALAVWRVNPQAFDEFDQWLFATEYSRYANEARTKAIALVGEERLDEALADSMLRKQLGFGGEIYRMFDKGTIPKLIDRHRVFTGRVEDTAKLHQVLTIEFGFSLAEPKSESAQLELDLRRFE